MKNEKSDEGALPRPVSPLPEYAKAQARVTLAEKLAEAFALPPVAAVTIANAVVDPAAVRKSIGDPNDPAAEEIRVQGGVLLGIRTYVWTRKAMPDPHNPRIGPSRKHPFAVEPGKGGEDTRFRPIPAPRMADPQNSTLAHLVVDVESREHLDWGCQRAAAYVTATNDWNYSIRMHGVMEPVWLAVTTYLAADGTEPATAMTTVEGSSRMTAAHAIIGVRSADVPYESSEAALRARIRKLNERLGMGAGGEDLDALRCEQVPALIVVGFRPHAHVNTGFPTAVKSWVALRHVDAPKEWGDGPANESLADEALEEIFRRGQTTAAKRDYYAGDLTKEQAVAAHLSPDPAHRAAGIVRLLTSKDPEITDAIRVAVSSQSTRKRVNSTMRYALATALVLRSVSADASRVEQIRRYMRHAYSKVVRKADWESTGRDTADLMKAALEEHRTSIREGVTEEKGPASVELSVRAAYALIVSGNLAGDKGTINNTQPDRRTPGEVLDAMRQTTQGIYQLGQALRDFADGVAARAVDENGSVRKLDDGVTDMTINDDYLRSEFTVSGLKRSQRPGDTPTDRYNLRLIRMRDAVAEMHEAFLMLVKEAGDDGQSIVDMQGVDHKLCSEWRDVLREVDDSLVLWGIKYRSVFGNGAPASPREELGDEAAPGVVDEWDRRAGNDPDDDDAEPETVPA